LIFADKKKAHRLICVLVFVFVGVDPKSVVCVFFKQGLCQKGDKCKFSHDLSKERKAEKRSIYDDMRDEQASDTMDKWDEKKLEDVVNQKHGEDNKQKNTTQIVYDFLLVLARVWSQMARNNFTIIIIKGFDSIT
jgi:hypothetical protein